MQRSNPAESAAPASAPANDVVLYRAKPHLLALAGPAAVALVATPLGVWSSGRIAGLGATLGLHGETAAPFEHAVRWLLVAAAAVMVVWLARVAADVLTTTYAVTASGVSVATGLIGRSTATVFLHKVESVCVSQGPFARICRTGTVSLIGAGGHRDDLAYVRDCAAFASTIERAALALRDTA